MDKTYFFTLIFGIILIFIIFAGLCIGAVYLYEKASYIEPECKEDMSDYNCTKILSCDKYCSTVNDTVQCYENYMTQMETICGGN